MPAATPELDALADKLGLSPLPFVRNAIRSRKDLIETWVTQAVGGLLSVDLQWYLDGWKQMTGEDLTDVQDVHTIIQTVLNRNPGRSQVVERFIRYYEEWTQTHVPRSQAHLIPTVQPADVGSLEFAALVNHPPETPPSQYPPSVSSSPPPPTSLDMSGIQPPKPRGVKSKSGKVWVEKNRTQDVKELTGRKLTTTTEAQAAKIQAQRQAQTGKARTKDTAGDLRMGGDPGMVVAMAATSSPAAAAAAGAGVGGGTGRDESKPWKQRPNVGAYTGAPRPKYPTVFRPYGHNTRQRVVGDRSGVTRMHTMGYAKGIVESLPTSSLFPSTHCSLGQSGAPAVLAHIPACRTGSTHVLFTVR